MIEDFFDDISSILGATKLDAASIGTRIHTGDHVERMREKIPIPDDFYFHLDKGEESLSQLAERFGVSKTTIRRWRDAWQKDDLAVITRDLDAPMSMNTWESRFLRAGQRVRVVNVREKEADVSVESIFQLNTVIVPLNALRRIREGNGEGEQ